MEVGEGAGESIWKTQSSVYYRASFSYSKHRQRDESKGKCLRLCNQEGVIMNIEWDYNYYQPWSNNKQLVDKMLAMFDEDIIIQ